MISMSNFTSRRADGAGFVAIALLCAVTLSGCDGPLSALDPAGQSADEIHRLFWWMTGGGIVIWLTFVGMTYFAVRISPQPHDPRQTEFWIIGGGAVVPTIVLTGLLVYGLEMLPRMVRPAPPGSLQIDVTGLQWWWRVEYRLPEGGTVETANEIRLPVGEPVQFHLKSADVIHSFWIPSLGGKVDMIPGRETRLTLEPNRTGTFRGICAEYCGASHALMAFDVVVMTRPEFDAWLTEQQRDGIDPADATAERGRDVFVMRGCGACHTIRGTTSDGRAGPDLTHVGSRLSLGAGTLSNDPHGFGRWVAETSSEKPSVKMPDFRMLAAEELEALATYLEGLQ